MEKVFDFIYILAWIFGVLSTLLVLIQLGMAVTYNKLDELKDKMNGVRQTFPVLKPGIIMILCWVWILIN